MMKKIIKIIYLFIFIAMTIFVANINVKAYSNYPEDTLLKVQGVKGAAVYRIGSDHKKYLYPDQNTFKTWYDDFSKVMAVSAAILDEYPDGGLITFQPGTRLITHQNTAKVYAVGEYGDLTYIPDEATARKFYGDAWASIVTDIDPGLFSVSYRVNNKILAEDSLPNGTLIQEEDSGNYFLIKDGQKQMIEEKSFGDYDLYRKHIITLKSLTGLYDDSNVSDINTNIGNGGGGGGSSSSDNTSTGTDSVSTDNTDDVSDTILSDISISNILVNPSAPTVNQNGITITVYIQNSGTVSLTDLTGILNFYYSFPNFVVSSNTTPTISNSNSLDPNETISITWTGYFSSAGTKTLAVTADYSNQLTESNESNNSYSKTVTVAEEEPVIVDNTCEASGSGTCYYVATTGNDSNSGDINNPFRTVQRGANALDAPGDVLYLRQGTYTENVTRIGSNPLNGSVQYPITIKSYSGETAVMDGNHATQTLILEGSHLVVEDLDIINGGNGSSFTLYPSDDVIIRNLDVYGTGGNCDGNSAQIYLQSSSNVVVENNTVHDNTYGPSSGDYNCGGIGVNSSDYVNGTRNITIRNNVIHDMLRGTGLWQKHPGEGTLDVYNNIVYNVYTGAIIRNRNTHLHNNIFYNINDGVWSDIGNGYNTIPNNENSIIEYNTFSTCDSNAIFYRYGTNLTIRNNIYHECTDTSGGDVARTMTVCMYGIYCDDLDPIWHTDASISEISSSNNCIYHTPDTLSFLRYDYPRTNYQHLSLSQAQSIYGLEIGSVFANPQFMSVDPQSSNFLRPSSGSACVNVGYYAS